jgi:cardiolipin synthase (CMP-forming)
MLRSLPNLISLLRMILVWPVVVLLLREQYGVALLVFTVAGASDGLDGFLAKRFGWKTRLGAILDPLADKLLLISCYLTLTWLTLSGKGPGIPVWLTATVIARDLVIVFGGLGYHLFVGRFDPAPSALSKLNTLAQITLVLAVMLQQSVLPLPSWMLTGLVYLVLVTTVASGLHYVVTWGWRAVGAGRGSGVGQALPDPGDERAKG